jgi:hypothetical protein
MDSQELEVEDAKKQVILDALVKTPGGVKVKDENDVEGTLTKMPPDNKIYFTPNGGERTLVSPADLGDFTLVPSAGRRRRRTKKSHKTRRHRHRRHRTRKA